MGAPAKATLEEDSITGEIATAVKHSFVYGIGSILGKAFAFLLLPLYTHYLSPRDYGVFEVLELSMSLLGMFLNMGITAALLRFYGAAQTEEQKRKVVGSLFLFALGASAVVLAGGRSGGAAGHGPPAGPRSAGHLPASVVHRFSDRLCRQRPGYGASRQRVGRNRGHRRHPEHHWSSVAERLPDRGTEDFSFWDVPGPGNHQQHQHLCTLQMDKARVAGGHGLETAAPGHRVWSSPRLIEPLDVRAELLRPVFPAETAVARGCGYLRSGLQIRLFAERPGDLAILHELARPDVRHPPAAGPREDLCADLRAVFSGSDLRRPWAWRCSARR